MRYLIRIALGLLWSAAAHAQGFDNDSVVALHRAGLGDSAIIAKIDSLPCAYDVSTDRLISLKGAGLSDDVIAAMIARCAGADRAQGVETVAAGSSGHPAPGIYFVTKSGASTGLQLLRPVIASGERTTGNGSLLFPFKLKLVIPRSRAQVTTHGDRPVFDFYFDTADSDVGGFGTVNTVAAQSPEEFSLVRFKQKNNGREVDIGRLAGNARSAGIDPKYTLSFVSQELGDGAFSVTPDEHLAPGEYAFILTGEKGRTRIYDFSVAGGPAGDAGK